MTQRDTHRGRSSPPTSSPPPPIGRDRIGRYEIIYPISQGGMAAVYAGRLRGIAGFQRLVAIKVIHSHLSGEERFIRMFLDEARLAAGIHHPNVGEVFEVGEDNGLYYMVCELILGQSLRSLRLRAAAQNIAVSPVLYARICSAACLALQAAHDLTNPDGESLRLVHRDVSPRNILVTYDGFVKLIDFGVAYAQGRISHTDVGTLKGKLGFMSPEQLRGLPVDRRSDIFSLGVVLYQLITGKAPFYGSTEIERLNKLLDFEFEKPSELAPDLSSELEQIILKAMSFSPADRFPTAQAMGAALEAFIRTSNVSTEPEDLALLMQFMFREEREYHLQKLRELGDKKSNAERLSIDEVTVNMRAPTSSLPGKPKELNPSVPQAMSRKHRFKARTAMIAAATVSAVLLILLLAYKVIFAPSPEIEPAQKRTSNQTPNDSKSPEVTNVVPLEMGDAAPTTAADPKSQIKLTIAPDGAQPTLDDSPIQSDTNNLVLEADGAARRLRVSADGYIDKTERLPSDTDKTLFISLEPSSSAQKKPSARDGSKKRPSEIMQPNKPTAANEPPDDTGEKKDANVPDSKRSTLLEKSPYQ